MKVIITSTKNKTYLLRLPNYIDHEAIPQIVEKATRSFRYDEKVKGWTLHSDQYHTDAERKQIDTKGRVTDKMIELPYDPLATSRKELW